MSPHSDFRVSVTKDYLVFSSAHFITFTGHRCEPLHGHNYRAGIVIEGVLEPESWYVINFSVVKQMMKRLCDAIDHKVLLPLQNPKLQITEQGEFVHVAYEQKARYMFPKADCALLPIPNTTVEMLARYLAKQALVEIHRMGSDHLNMLELEVEENFGQSAVYREILD